MLTCEYDSKFRWGYQKNAGVQSCMCAAWRELWKWALDGTEADVHSGRGDGSEQDHGGASGGRHVRQHPHLQHQRALRAGMPLQICSTRTAALPAPA